jgi:hypothetical protein
MIRIVDDTEEDYLYNKDNFELVEDYNWKSKKNLV